ncbi:hypothetical protein J3B02_005517, partial [Coemansia erecta]
MDSTGASSMDSVNFSSTAQTSVETSINNGPDTSNEPLGTTKDAISQNVPDQQLNGGNAHVDQAASAVSADATEAALVGENGQSAICTAQRTEFIPVQPVASSTSYPQEHMQDVMDISLTASVSQDQRYSLDQSGHDGHSLQTDTGVGLYNEAHDFHTNISSTVADSVPTSVDAPANPAEATDFSSHPYQDSTIDYQPSSSSQGFEYMSSYSAQPHAPTITSASVNWSHLADNGSSSSVFDGASSSTTAIAGPAVTVSATTIAASSMLESSGFYYSQAQEANESTAQVATVGYESLDSQPQQQLESTFSTTQELTYGYSEAQVASQLESTGVS